MGITRLLEHFSKSFVAKNLYSSCFMLFEELLKFMAPWCYFKDNNYSVWCQTEMTFIATRDSPCLTIAIPWHVSTDVARTDKTKGLILLL